MRTSSSLVKLGFAIFLAAGCSAFAATSALAVETKLRVAAAADLKFALPILVSNFEKQNASIKVETIFGSSGSLTQQIQAGAPFDLFLSADDSFPERLKKEGKADGEVFRYGTGHLVLWAPKKVDLQKLVNPKLATLKVLEAKEISKFAVANPAVAPYGRVADEALEKAKLKEVLKPKMVMGENVAQTAQFAMTGAVSASLIAQALAESPEMKAAGTYLHLKPDEAAVLKQSGVVVEKSKLKAEAKKFRDLLLGAEGQKVLAGHGLAETK